MKKENDDCVLVRSSSGRPKDERKRASIIEAAKEQFLTHGFQRTNMDAIAESAGVSKLTIYNHFKNKNNLFKEVIGSKCREHVSQEIYDKASHLPVKDGIASIAFGYIKMMTQPDMLQLHRVILSECERYPNIAQVFYDCCPKHHYDAFKKYVELAVSKGWLAIPDKIDVCDQFFSMLRGNGHLRLLLKLDPTPSWEEISEYTQSCVELFMNAYRKKPEAA